MNGTPGLQKTALIVCAHLLLLPGFLAAQQNPSREALAAPFSPIALRSESLLRADFPGHKGWRSIQAGSVLEGRLSLPLYEGGEVVAHAGTQVRVTVRSVDRIKRPSGFWRNTGRAIVRAFNPFETSHPAEYRVDLTGATLLLPSGESLPLRGRVLRAASVVLVEPKTNPASAASAGKSKPSAALLMAVESPAPSSSLADPIASDTVGQSHAAHAYLLTPLRASVNHEGDTFQAVLAESLRLGDCTFPPGSILSGTVIRSVPPRMLNRAGKLSVRIDHILSAEADPLRVDGTLSGAEADSRTRFALDDEGVLRGRKPGVLNAVVDLGYAYALGKAADDISETPIRAIGASMSDAAVANAARYVGLGTSLAFLLTRHGRDVYLPKYALLEIDFGRAKLASQ